MVYLFLSTLNAYLSPPLSILKISERHSFPTLEVIASLHGFKWIFKHVWFNPFFSTALSSGICWRLLVHYIICINVYTPS